MLHFHVISWKFGTLLAWSTSFLAVAVSEAFLGQMIIALTTALIGATPPTVAIILMARKQSEERRVAQGQLLAGQGHMLKELDGKLDELRKAEKGVAKAEGVEQERTEERDRVAAAVVVAPVPAVPEVPAKIEIVNPTDRLVPTIPGKKQHP